MKKNNNYKKCSKTKKNNEKVSMIQQKIYEISFRFFKEELTWKKVYNSFIYEDKLNNNTGEIEEIEFSFEKELTNYLSKLKVPFKIEETDVYTTCSNNYSTLSVSWYENNQIKMLVFVLW